MHSATNGMNDSFLTPVPVFGPVEFYFFPQHLMKHIYRDSHWGFLMEADWSYDPKTHQIVTQSVPIANCDFVGPFDHLPTHWNGWLLAAAPDLLRSLDDILRLLKHYAPEVYYRNDAVARADDAFKKATGEA